MLYKTGTKLHSLLKAVQNCNRDLRRGHHGPVRGASYSCKSCQQLRCPAMPESSRRSMTLLGSGVLLSSTRMTSCNSSRGSLLAAAVGQ